MTTYTLALAGTASALWLLLVVQTRPMTIATAAFLVAFSAQSQVGLNNELTSRIPILLLFGLALLYAIGDRRTQLSSTNSLASLRTLTVAIVLLLGGSMYSSIDIPATIQALSATAAVFFVGITLGRYVPVKALFDRLALASGMICAAGVAAIAVSGDAFLGDRLSGIFRNPNAMGSAVLLSLVAMPQRYLLWATPPLTALLVLTGSRASGLGFLVVLVLRVKWRPATRLGAAVTAPLLVMLFALVGVGAFNQEVETPLVTDSGPATTSEEPVDDEVAILRTRDNRSSQWRQGWADFRDNLPLGVGFGNAGFEYSNSMLFLLVETGALAVPIAATAAVLAWRASGHDDTRVRALAAGLFVHGLFEGWMFAFGSFQAIIYWMLLTAALAERLHDRNQSPGVLRQHRSPVTAVRA